MSIIIIYHLPYYETREFSVCRIHQIHANLHDSAVRNLKSKDKQAYLGECPVLRHSPARDLELLREAAFAASD